jgi:RNA polymerase sigma-70 factor (ECF subfamily)
MENSGTPRDRRLKFEQTALPHLDSLYSAALRLARNTDDAKDLLQETVLRAYRCFHQYTPGTNCRAWLLTILYNVFRTGYRRGGRELVGLTVEEFEHELEVQTRPVRGAQDDPENLVAERSTGRLIERAVTALPEEFREALILVDVHELNYQEAAEALDIPLGTVKSRVSRARALLRTALVKYAVLPGKTGT